MLQKGFSLFDYTVFLPPWDASYHGRGADSYKNRPLKKFLKQSFSFT